MILHQLDCTKSSVAGIFCADVPSLTNGQVLRTDNSVGTTVYFQCDSRYQLQGPSSLTCMTSGQWNGNFPYCQGSSNSLFVLINT